MAAYLENLVNSHTTNAGVLLNADSKYKEVYKVGETDTRINNYNANKGRVGEAIQEMSRQYSWQNDGSDFPQNTGYGAVFIRGGQFNSAWNAGVFCFDSDAGHARFGNSFRVVYIP